MLVACYGGAGAPPARPPAGLIPFSSYWEQFVASSGKKSVKSEAFFLETAYKSDAFRVVKLCFFFITLILLTCCISWSVSSSALR